MAALGRRSKTGRRRMGGRRTDDELDGGAAGTTAAARRGQHRLGRRWRDVVGERAVNPGSSARVGAPSPKQIEGVAVRGDRRRLVRLRRAAAALAVACAAPPISDISKTTIGFARLISPFSLLAASQIGQPIVAGTAIFGRQPLPALL
uniref:Uncharacterized protein n=1 Tax=Leersia perrieri TaxID=77586 RepID=A0A0D9X079_9ORYZ